VKIQKKRRFFDYWEKRRDLRHEAGFTAVSRGIFLCLLRLALSFIRHGAELCNFWFFS
jgi:hypothetical protein